MPVRAVVSGLGWKGRRKDSEEPPISCRPTLYPTLVRAGREIASIAVACIAPHLAQPHMWWGQAFTRPRTARPLQCLLHNEFRASDCLLGGECHEAQRGHPADAIRVAVHVAEHQRQHEICPVSTGYVNLLPQTPTSRTGPTRQLFWVGALTIVRGRNIDRCLHTQGGKKAVRINLRDVAEKIDIG